MAGDGSSICPEVTLANRHRISTRKLVAGVIQKRSFMWLFRGNQVAKRDGVRRKRHTAEGRVYNNPPNFETRTVPRRIGQTGGLSHLAGMLALHFQPLWREAISPACRHWQRAVSRSAASGSGARLGPKKENTGPLRASYRHSQVVRRGTTRQPRMVKRRAQGFSPPMAAVDSIR